MNTVSNSSKATVQLAQARIIALNDLTNSVLGVKAVGWIANQIISRSDDTIRNEYNAAINNIYNLARTCSRVFSKSLPTAPISNNAEK